MEAFGLFALLVLAFIIGFPIYVLAKLSSLDSDVRELKYKLGQIWARDMQPAAAGAGAPLLRSPAPQPGVAPVIPSPPPRSAEQREKLLERIARPEPSTSAATPAAPWPPASWSHVPPAPQPAAPKPAAASLAPTVDLESLLGANWLAKLGIAAIAIGIAFFLQYAFRNGWIGPSAQVGIGLAVAGTLVISGQLLLKKPGFRSYAEMLFSGGVVVYFLSIYAAYGFYQPRLLGFGPAFAAFAIGALAASALAIANDTEIVAVICTLGAFAAPVLIRESNGPPSGEGAFRLYGYLVLMNVWVAALIRMRGWHSLTLVAFTCTWLIFFAARPIEGSGWPVETFAALFLAAACGMGWNAIRSSTDRSGQILRQAGAALIIVGCVAFTVASFGILSHEELFDLPAVMTAGMFVALLLAGLSTLMTGVEDDQNLQQVFGYVAAAALAIVTLTALSPVTAVAADRAKPAFAFSLFNLILFLVIGWMMGRRDSSTAAALLVANAITHARAAFVTLGGISFFGVPGYIVWLPAAGLLFALFAWLESADREEMSPLGVSSAIAGLALPVIALVSAYSGAMRWEYSSAYLFLAEFVVSFVIWLGCRKAVVWDAFRADLVAPLVSAAVFFGLAGRVFHFDTVNGFVILAGIALGMAAFHLLAALTVLRGEEEDPLRRLLYGGIAITFLTVAAPIQLKAAHITVAWAVEGAALIYAGLKAKEDKARAYGLGVLMLAGGRAIVFDLQLGSIRQFLLNERMLAGAFVIAACYAAAWMMSRWKDELADDERPIPAGLVAVANAFTLLFVSVDLWEHVGRTMQNTGAVSAQQLSLSLFWTAYALILVSVGIWLRTRPVRLFGIGLLYLSIFKVFLLDLSGLEQPYKIVSFLALGVILLAVSLLYTRFESRLQDDSTTQVPTPAV